MKPHYHVGGYTFLVRPNTTDIKIINEVVEKKVYLRHFSISKNDNVVDIGAHIGSFSILASSLGGKVCAYEPYYGNFDLLRNNVFLNDVPVKCFDVGVMGRGGWRNLHIRRRNLGGCSFYTTDLDTIKVRCVLLRDVFHTNHIGVCDFLKLDCEGAELEILKSFKDFKRIRKIVIEGVGEKQGKEITELLPYKNSSYEYNPATNIWFYYGW